MADNVVGIKFGVAGGKSLSGESGALIKSQLESIASKIKLKININKTYFTSQLSSLRKELDKTLGNLNINIRANTRTATVGGGTSSEITAANEQVASYESVRKALERLYQARERLIKLPSADKDQTVKGTLLISQAKELEDKYSSQFEALQKKLGAESKEIKQINELKASLDAAHSAQLKMANAPEIASDTALAKLQTKAASLYVDNGFDKIIDRSSEAARIVDAFNDKVNLALNNKGSITKEEVQVLNTEFISLQGRLKAIGRETDTTGNKIKEAFDSRVVQRIAQVLLLSMVRALKKVYDNVKEINTAMTELQIVTMATSSQMEKTAKEIARSARSIGASISDLTNSTTVYARLGYELADAQTLAEKTTIYARVAGVNVNEATTNITGIIKAFNIGADGLEAVLDQLMWVGNNFPISQAEIGEAMNNAASALVANGNTLQEAIAIVTAANTTLQNVSKSSTAVRTIAARIARSSAELEALGEDAGTVLSTSRLQERMSAFGVAIIDANGELRSTYDILADVAAVWDDINSVDKAAIAEMLAGTRQQSAFYSIVQNWGDAQKIVEDSGNAAGALMDAQEIRLESIEGKLEQLKATWESVSQNLLDSALVTAIIEIVKTIGEVINAVTSLGDGIIPKAGLVIAATAGILAAMQKIVPFIQTARLQFKILSTELGVTATGIKGFFATVGTAMQKFLAKNAPLLIISTIITLMTALSGKAKGWAELIAGAVTIIATAIIIGVKGVDATIKGFMATNPIGWILLAISAVISVVKGIFDLIEAFNPSYETLKEQAKDSIDAWKDAEDELDAVKDKLEEVSAQIDELNKKDSLSLVDKEQLEYLEQEKANLEAIQAAKETEAKKAKEQAAGDVANALGKYNDTHTVDDAPWWEWLLIGPFAFIHQGIAWGSDTYEEKFNQILEDYQNASQEDKDFISSTLKEYGEMLDGFDFGDNAELDGYLSQYYSMIDRYNLQTGNAAQTWNRVLKDSRFTSEVEKLQALADSQGVSMEAISAAAPEFLAYLKEIGVYIDGDAASADALVESIEQLRKKLELESKITFTDDIDIMQDKFDSLSKALQDIESNGVISMDNIAKIIDKDAEGYPDLLKKYFRYIDGVGYTLADEWSGKSKSEILTAMAQDEIQAYADKVAKAQEILSGMTDDNEDYQTAIENVAITQENLNTKVTEWATILREQALEDETERLEKLQEALEDQSDKYKDLIDIRKDLLSTYKEEVNYQKELAQKQKAVADLQTQLSLARLDTSAAGQARARELQEQLDEARDKLDEYTLERAIDDLTKQLDKDYDEYQKFIQEEIDLIVKTIENLASTFKLNLTPNNDGSVSVESHHTGGFVGNVVSLKSNEEFAKLLKGELVSTPKQIDGFMRRTLPNIIVRGRGGGATINNNSPLIEIKCGNVDPNTMPQLKAIVDQAVDRIEKNMESALARTGYKKKY